MRVINLLIVCLIIFNTVLANGCFTTNPNIGCQDCYKTSPATCNANCGCQLDSTLSCYTQQDQCDDSSDSGCYILSNDQPISDCSLSISDTCGVCAKSDDDHFIGCYQVNAGIGSGKGCENCAFCHETDILGLDSYCRNDINYFHDKGYTVVSDDNEYTYLDDPCSIITNKADCQLCGETGDTMSSELNTGNGDIGCRWTMYNYYEFESGDGDCYLSRSACQWYDYDESQSLCEAEGYFWSSTESFCYGDDPVETNDLSNELVNQEICTNYFNQLWTGLECQQVNNIFTLLAKTKEKAFKVRALSDVYNYDAPRVNHFWQSAGEDFYNFDVYEASGNLIDGYCYKGYNDHEVLATTTNDDDIDCCLKEGLTWTYYGGLLNCLDGVGDDPDKFQESCQAIGGVWYIFNGCTMSEMGYNLDQNCCEPNERWRETYQSCSNKGYWSADVACCDGYIGVGSADSNPCICSFVGTWVPSAGYNAKCCGDDGDADDFSTTVGECVNGVWHEFCTDRFDCGSMEDCVAGHCVSVDCFSDSDCLTNTFYNYNNCPSCFDIWDGHRSCCAGSNRYTYNCIDGACVKTYVAYDCTC